MVVNQINFYPICEVMHLFTVAKSTLESAGTCKMYYMLDSHDKMEFFMHSAISR